MPSAFSDFDLNCHRVYYKDSADSYTFRLEAHKESSNTAIICFATLMATYFPTSYGSVTTVSYTDEDGQNRIDSYTPTGATNLSLRMTDLRLREVAINEARREDLKAKLEQMDSSTED